MNLLPIGVHFGPHIKLNDLTALDIINRVYGGKPGVALVMEGSTWIADAMPKGSLVVQRLHWVFEDVRLDGITEKQCYDYGREKALFIVGAGPGAHFPGVTHFMGTCESKLDEVMDGRRLGAFDAGCTDVFLAAGFGYCGLNSSMGKPESTSAPTRKPVIEAYFLSLSQWSENWEWVLKTGYNQLALHNGLPILIIGYHMYQTPGVDSQYLSLRPWAFWKPDLWNLGLIMPPILGTEAGVDKVGVGGYRKVFPAAASENYGGWISVWPSHHKEAIGGCFYGVLMGESNTESWHDRGFDFEEDEIVVQAMATANRNFVPPATNGFGSKMDDLWRPVQQRIWNTPAFKKMWLKNQDIGSVVSVEFDYGGYRLQQYEYAWIWAKIGDWGNCHVARTRDEMPPLVLSG